MWFVGRHDDGIARGQKVGNAQDADFRLPVQDVNEGVVGRGVLAQFLSRVEGEERHVASVRFGDLAADDRAFLVRGQVGHFQDLGFGRCGHELPFFRFIALSEATECT